jgi:LPS sulfotransferase NodH
MTLEVALHDSEQASRTFKPVFIAATHRCGSYLLCDLLESYGGLPYAEEYLNDNLLTARRLLRCGPDVPNNTVLKQLDEHCQREFGGTMIKAMWPAFLTIFHPMAVALYEDPKRLNDVVNALFPGVRFLFVRRRDKIRQAVSFERALQTGVWRQRVDAAPGDGHNVPLHYSYRSILRCLRQLEEDESSWVEYFQNHQLNYHTIWYEDLVADREAVLQSALAYLGCKPVSETVPEPGVRPVSDGVNADWADRFRKRYDGPLKLPALTELAPTASNLSGKVKCDQSGIGIPCQSCAIVTFSITNTTDQQWTPFCDKSGHSTLSLALITEDPEGKSEHILAEEDIEEEIEPQGMTNVNLRISHDGHAGKRNCHAVIRENGVNMPGGLPLTIDYLSDDTRNKLATVFAQADLTNWKDWYRLPALGNVYAVSFPWLYQFEHGWIQLLMEESEQGIAVFEDPALGKIRIHLERYPEIEQLTAEGVAVLRLDGVENGVRRLTVLRGGRQLKVPINEPAPETVA